MHISASGLRAHGGCQVRHSSCHARGLRVGRVTGSGSNVGGNLSGYGGGYSSGGSSRGTVRQGGQLNKYIIGTGKNLDKFPAGKTSAALGQVGLDLCGDGHGQLPQHGVVATQEFVARADGVGHAGTTLGVIGTGRVIHHRHLEAFACVSVKPGLRRAGAGQAQAGSHYFSPVFRLVHAFDDVVDRKFAAAQRCDGADCIGAHIAQAVTEGHLLGKIGPRVVKTG